MGMFTTIITRDLRNLQIKCGWDQCNTYNVGQEVKQWVDPNCPGGGYLLDGVYDSYGDKGASDFVIIKDSYILATVNRDEAYEESDHAKKNVWAYLKELYQVQDPPRSLWSEEVWTKREEREKKSKEETDAFQQTISHLSARDQFIAVMARPLRSMRVDYHSLAQKAFIVEPMPEGALDYYEKEDK